MKRLLMAFTAIAAVAGPLAAPIQALAQDRQPGREQRDADRPQISRGDRPARPERPQGQDRPQQSRPDRPSRPERPANSTPRPDRPNAGENRPTRPDRPSNGAVRPDRPSTGESRPGRPDRPQNGGNRPDRPNVGGDRPSRPDRPGAGRPDRPDQPSNGGRPDRPSNGGRPDRPGDNGGRPNRPDRPDNGWNRPDRPNNGQVRPGQPNRPGSGWNQNRDRHDDFRRRFNSDQWRRDFYRNHRSDWWRNDRRFHGYNGIRAGFYFAPGWGYYSVPRSYWGRYWSVGDYLPDTFWRYRLDDWRTYGLGYPPAGTRWVLVDNTIYLIDDYDGYIIDVIRDAWRW